VEEFLNCPEQTGAISALGEQNNKQCQLIRSTVLVLAKENCKNEVVVKSLLIISGIWIS